MRAGEKTEKENGMQGWERGKTVLLSLHNHVMFPGGRQQCSLNPNTSSTVVHMYSHRQGPIQTFSGYTLPGFLIPQQFSDMKHAGMRVVAHHEPDCPFISLTPKHKQISKKMKTSCLQNGTKHNITLLSYGGGWVSSTKTKSTFSNIIAYNQQCGFVKVNCLLKWYQDKRLQAKHVMDPFSVIPPGRR